MVHTHGRRPMLKVLQSNAFQIEEEKEEVQAVSQKTD